MADVDLEEIRRQRLAQMRSEYGDRGRNENDEGEKQRQMEEMKNNILSQILDQSARARLNTLMVGKPEKGRMVENMLLQRAQSGLLPHKISESELICILESISQQTTKSTTVKFDRRRAALDSDDEFS